MFCPPECNFISVFCFPIYYYGLTLALAIFVGVFISHRIALKQYMLPNIIPSIATSVILSGIIGARLYYCLINWEFYMKTPIAIFAVREGGLSIHGAILGGVIALYCLAKRYNISFLKLCDIASLGMPIAQAIGRLGNFFNSEAFGIPTDLPWKMYIREEFRPIKYANYSYFHPTFLYELILNVVIFCILYYVVLPKNKEKFGITAATYLVLYSLIRIPIECLRTDCSNFVIGIPLPIVISIFLAIYGICFIILKVSKTVK